MQFLLRLLREEPVMVASLIIIIVNLIDPLSQEKQDAITRIFESIAILLGGTAVRSIVTPTAKLNGGS